MKKEEQSESKKIDFNYLMSIVNKDEEVIVQYKQPSCSSDDEDILGRREPFEL